MNEGHEPIPNFNPYTRRGKALIAEVKTLIPGLTTNEAVYCLKTGIWARPRPMTGPVLSRGPVPAYRMPGIYTETSFETLDKNEVERRSRFMNKLAIGDSQCLGDSVILVLRRLRLERGWP